MEDLMDDRDLICMNDGRGTRINIANGSESAIDNTLLSKSLAGISKWEVLSAKTVAIVIQYHAT